MLLVSKHTKEMEICKKKYQWTGKPQSTAVEERPKYYESLLFEQFQNMFVSFSNVLRLSRLSPYISWFPEFFCGPEILEILCSEIEKNRSFLKNVYNIYYS